MANYPNNTPTKRYDPSWGNPIICYLDPDTVGKPGYQMMGLPSMRVDDPGARTDFRYVGASDSTLYRHFTLPEGASVQGMLEPQLGQRRYRVSVQFNDVTWPAYNPQVLDETGNGASGVSKTQGGDY